ncbi:FxSxx-COOH system tetratricopeptide repeat protein [Streptomyces boncukensis]|uniref:Tetratricopeptide repeat protein n=1 Tax=Streptomyces boncukensis TaxID=2711219 RepID=A0A6G4X1Z0_9ACTN|nr:FxSxx-COOH system tetratricopeptide repeat protein [Streptomyces boncukensis]NGO70764.1 tetratricopeptide repeat protein [Streptomyces boncukensis]
MAAQRNRAGSGRGTPSDRRPEHFVVAFPGYQRPWATWIAHRLEAHGHRVSLHRWDPGRDQPLRDALGDLMLASGRVLLVLSQWFFQLGPRGEGEWNAVLRGFVREHADQFAAVNLTNKPLLPAVNVLEPVDLWGVGEEEAERRLLRRLALNPAPHPLTGARTGSRYPNDPPRVWGEVPRRNPGFTGRDVLLNEVQERLMDAERDAAVCVLVGSSGIGKTQIAAEYAHRFLPDYDVVWWINSDQRGTQRDRYAELAVELGLRTGSEPGERIRAVRDALRRGEPYGRWLLIFDGWEETEEVTGILPRGGPGHILITSRNRAWREVADVREVPVFERAESTGYLMRRAPHITAEEADQVAVDSQDLPIQLAIAGGLLGEERMAVEDYLRRVRSGELAELEQDVVPGDYPLRMYTSQSMLLNQLRRSEPRAVELLKLCTCFAAGRIPIGLVRGLRAAGLPEELRWMAGDRPDWPRSLDALVNRSVVTRESRSLSVTASGEPGLQQESVHMHRAVHRILSELTAGEDRNIYRSVVCQVLAVADPGDPVDSRNWARYAELLPHLDPAGALESETEDSRALVLNCVRYCYESGEYTAGIELADRVRESWSPGLAPTSRPMLDLTTWQTTILRASGRFTQAYDLDTTRLGQLYAAGEPDRVALLSAHHGLASDQRFLGRYSEALATQQQVVDTATEVYGPEETFTLNARHSLAATLRLLGRYHEAYDVDLDTLRKREQVLRARHPATLHSGTACARDLRRMGRYQDALARQELGVRLHAQVLGEQHLQTLWARHNLVMCQYRAGSDTQDIRAAFADLHQQHERGYPQGHYNILGLMSDYGNFLRARGWVAEARDLIVEAEDGYRALVGTAHPVPTGMQTNVGLVLQAEGDRDGALNLFNQAFAGLSTVLGEDHPWTLGCALNAAGGRSFTGRPEEAAELDRDTLRRARRVLGPDHPFTLSCQIALAADLRALHEAIEADKQEEDALQRLTSTLGVQHHHTLSARQRNRPYWDFEPFLG